MVTARQRRRVVEHLKARCVSERRVCRLVGFSRSSAWRPFEARDAEGRRKFDNLRCAKRNYQPRLSPEASGLFKTIFAGPSIRRVSLASEFKSIACWFAIESRITI